MKGRTVKWIQDDWNVSSTVYGLSWKKIVCEIRKIVKLTELVAMTLLFLQNKFKIVSKGMKHTPGSVAISNLKEIKHNKREIMLNNKNSSLIWYIFTSWWRL